MTYIAVQICVESRVSNYLPRHNLDDALLAVVCALLPLKMPFKQWCVPFCPYNSGMCPFALEDAL
jgi:hypothetical protein